MSQSEVGTSGTAVRPRSGAVPVFGWVGLVVLVLALTGCYSSVAPRSLTAIPGRAGAGPALPGSLPEPDEELWVIARAESPAPEGEPAAPGSGILLARPPGEKEVPLPLRHTDVQASISAHLATVRVTQQFTNPYDGKIEAVYVFPLPHNAAVHEFLMVIGERRIRGIIRERADAERIYHDARSQGYVASLLTQERPNIFTQAVANLEPGRGVDIQLTYCHTLAYDDGWYEFVFPMVVGPRFNPPGWTAGIGAVSRGASGSSGQPTDVSYLGPGGRSGHDIALRVDLTGVPIEEVVCRTHAIAREVPAADRLTVTLDPADGVPNRDFVLRYRVAGERPKAQALVHQDGRGGFFTLMLFPPQLPEGLPRQPLELVFVLDCSGSMSGRPLDQAKAAVREGLRLLSPADTFQLIRFSNTASQLGPRPLPATPEHIGRGLEHLAGLRSEGGTFMLHGIRAALDFPADPERLRFVVFLTDGYIGNEVEILAEVRQRLGAARIFSFGVGSAVNRYLLEHLARLGRGAVAYLGLKDDGADVMGRFFARISQPVMTDLTVDWGTLGVTDVFPERAPDLFVGRPVLLTGRFTGKLPATVSVSGRCGGEPMGFTLPFPAETSAPRHPALPWAWARLKIAELADASALDPRDDHAGEIRQLALDYGLLSAFTAFVAVDASRRTEGEHGVIVPVAVPVPEGVRYDTTVVDDDQPARTADR